MSDQARRRVGVDLDGVLADQITGVLPRVNERHGLDLTYDDITDWRLPTGSSNIATEIVASLQEQEYVRRMAVHSGAAEMLAALVSRYEVVVLTAREGETLEWSVDWLRVHDFLSARSSERRSRTRVVTASTP